MGGESEQSKEAKRMQGVLGGYANEMKGLDTNVENRWNNWSPEFGYQDMSKMLDSIMASQMGDVNKQANLGIQQGQSDLAERMAGEGVTSSSIKESQNQNIRTGANRGRESLMSQLFQQNQSGKLGAMGEANKYGFMGNQQASSVDLSNINNLLQKYGLVGGAYGQQLGNVGNFDDTTWLDDVFASINTVSGFIDPLSGLFKGKAKSGGG